MHDGRLYLIVDLHCSKPTCPCTTIVAQVFHLDGDAAVQVGTVRFDSRTPLVRVDASSALVGDVYERLRAAQP